MRKATAFDPIASIYPLDLDAGIVILDARLSNRLASFGVARGETREWWKTRNPAVIIGRRLKVAAFTHVLPAF